MSRVGERKTRSDKKRDIKPTIRIDLKDALYRLSYITYTPVKDVAEKLTVMVLEDAEVVNHLSQYFKRDLKFNSTLFRGHAENPHIGHRDEGKTERISTRFQTNKYEAIAILAYTLDCTPSRTVTVLLEIAVRNIRFVNAYVKTYLGSALTEKQMLELRNVMKDVKKLNDGHHSWVALLGAIIDEVSAPVTKVKDAVTEFIRKNQM